MASEDELTAVHRQPTEHRGRRAIAVWEPIGVLSRSIQSGLLDGGYQPVLAASVHAISALLASIAIVSAGDTDISSIADIAAGGIGTSVIVLRDQSCTLTPAAFLAVGARSVLPRGVGGDICTLAVRAAELGCSVSLAGDAVAGLPQLAGVISRIGPAERSWIAGLARGETVAKIGAAAGYSERDMHRRLARLYDMLGATGRIEAALTAMRLGLIDPQPLQPTKP